MTLTSVLRPFTGVLRTGWTVLAQHWPQLVGLFLLGWAARMGFLWLAITALYVSPTLGVLLLPLAPMATLLSLVLMVRVTGESLPAFASLFEGTTPKERWRGNLAVAAQVLLPFLALYVSQGLLALDTRLFLVESNADMYLSQGQWTNTAEYATGPYLAAMILVAIVARKVIGVLDLTKRSLAWAFAATFLEVLWVVTLAKALTNELDTVTEWVRSRAVIAQVLDLWQGFLDWLPRVPFLKAIFDGIATFVANAGDLVIVPVAWLALGATIYGRQLATREEFENFRPLPDHDAVTQRIKKIPQPVRRYAAQVVEPVTTPVKETVSAIGKVAAAGVIPMVLFCLVFVLTSQVQVAVAWLWRLAVPATTETWTRWAVAPYAEMLERLAYFVLIVPLLGAAVNAVVVGERRDDASEDAEPAAVPA